MDAAHPSRKRGVTAGALIQVDVAKAASEIEYQFLTSELSSITGDIKTTLNGPSEAFGLFKNGDFGVEDKITGKVDARVMSLRVVTCQDGQPRWLGLVRILSHSS